MDRQVLDPPRSAAGVCQHRSHDGHPADLRGAAGRCCAGAGRQSASRRHRCGAGAILRIRGPPAAAGGHSGSRPCSASASLSPLQRAVGRALVSQPGRGRVDCRDHVRRQPRRRWSRSVRAARHLRRPRRDLDPQWYAARSGWKRCPIGRHTAGALPGGERCLPAGAAGGGGDEHVLRRATVIRRDHRCHGALAG